MSFYALSKWLKSKEKPPEDRPQMPTEPGSIYPNPLPYEPGAIPLPLPPSARGKDKPKKRPGGEWIWVPNDSSNKEIESYEPGTIPTWMRPPKRQLYNIQEN